MFMCVCCGLSRAQSPCLRQPDEDPVIRTVGEWMRDLRAEALNLD